MHPAKFSLIFTFILAQCTGNLEFSKNFTLPDGYELAEVNKIFLPGTLDEISGLAWKRPNEIWAIEDESSIIYSIDPKSGNIKRKQKFAKNKDIEDLLLAQDTAYVLQSNGNLYQIHEPLTKGFTTQIHEFPIDQKRDFEAIVTLDTEPSLLLFCKVCNWDKTPAQASVYRFDLVQKKFDTEIYMILKRSDIQAAFRSMDLSEIKIQPGAAAIHPITREIYLLSSTDRWLLVMNQQGDFLGFHHLPPSLFKQPEGITFAPDGTLYISNEARDGRANLLIFTYQP
ncbi:SdiA-regulated domain-containing protein [Algoriphagus sp.]|uniref:SdiA-regulated domain-containing protein n=1 Tax=Algoriphagus sp. TaxID=1872435 RepID=UPI002626145C|nr:SdiA-regulated domain-containing protein [Algoriphagus sp.]